MTSSKPKASVVISVYNEEDSIEACLDSLLAQTMPCEIIVVDDGSTDKTISILSSYDSKITLLKQDHLGPAYARNLGSSKAKGEILVFADADMTFDPNFLKVLVAPIVKGDAIGTFTVEERVANWDNVWARCWNIQEGWAPEKRFPPNPPKEGTDYRAILKSEFDKVGGFDDIGYTDTWSLYSKLGVRPLATYAVCYHHNPSSLFEVFWQAKWVGKRPYKLGVIGSIYALFRASLPVSLVIGTIKSAVFMTPHFLPFKLVYDLGIFLGILDLLLTGKTSK